jgi:hypothetical protein
MGPLIARSFLQALDDGALFDQALSEVRSPCFETPNASVSVSFR